MEQTKSIVPDWATYTTGTEHAKISIGSESFWVKKISYEDRIFTGTVDNDLVCGDSHGLKLGDEVSFFVAPTEAYWEMHKPIPWPRIKELKSK